MLNRVGNHRHASNKLCLSVANPSFDNNSYGYSKYNYTVQIDSSLCVLIQFVRIISTLFLQTTQSVGLSNNNITQFLMLCAKEDTVHVYTSM